MFCLGEEKDVHQLALVLIIIDNIFKLFFFLNFIFQAYL